MKESHIFYHKKEKCNSCIGQFSLDCPGKTAYYSRSPSTGGKLIFWRKWEYTYIFPRIKIFPRGSH